MFTHFCPYVNHFSWRRHGVHHRVGASASVRRHEVSTVPVCVCSNLCARACKHVDTHVSVRGLRANMSWITSKFHMITEWVELWQHTNTIGKCIANFATNQTNLMNDLIIVMSLRNHIISTWAKMRKRMQISCNHAIELCIRTNTIYVCKIWMTTNPK